MLYGYGGTIFDGAIMTIELAVLSVIFSIILGLFGACAKLFGNRPMIVLAHVYTTLIRGIPDLVLMMLIFMVCSWDSIRSLKLWDGNKLILTHSPLAF